jgi:membrane protease YdiL (CAAX protease family)
MDLAIVIGCFALAYLGAWSAHLSAPGTLAVIGAFAAASWRLAARGSSWQAVGVRLPESWLRAIIWAIVLYAASALLVACVVTPLSNAHHWPTVDLSRFSGLRGNAVALAGWLVLAWITAAIGEEFLFRGYLLTQLLAVLGKGRCAIGVAIVIQAALFGVAHAYLGLRGVLTAGCVGLIYGIVYLCNGRNLAPLILAHGLTDSLSLVAIYLGVVQLL